MEKPPETERCGRAKCGIEIWMELKAPRIAFAAFLHTFMAFWTGEIIAFRILEKIPEIRERNPEKMLLTPSDKEENVDLTELLIPETIEPMEERIPFHTEDATDRIPLNIEEILFFMALNLLEIVLLIPETTLERVLEIPDQIELMYEEIPFILDEMFEEIAEHIPPIKLEIPFQTIQRSIRKSLL